MFCLCRFGQIIVNMTGQLYIGRHAILKYRGRPFQ